jgi:glycosyltransferase involved in cell wall biosynthesis
MRIGIDARALSEPGGGEETYIRNVVRALAAVDTDNEYTLFLNPAAPPAPIAGTERMRRVEVWPRSRSVRLLATFSLALRREGIDVVQVQNTVPVLCPAPPVLNVHDISYERYPQFYLPAEVTRLRALMPLMVRRAASVLTLSEFCRADIVRRYRVAPQKVVVAPCAADPLFAPLPDAARLAAVRARYATGARFILCVGNLQPRKNLQTLIAAYVRLRQADATRHRLVLVGKAAWLYDPIFAAARASGYGAELIFTGYVPQEDLVALYNAADLFVYPSLFEGFGLPPLEALACGTPVIAANTAALPEVVGEAGVLVDPREVDGLAAAMARVLGDEALRQRLRVQGPERAARFSWDATARTIVDAYRRAAK